MYDFESSYSQILNKAKKKTNKKNTMTAGRMHYLSVEVYKTNNLNPIL